MKVTKIHEDTNVNQKVLILTIQQAIQERIDESDISLVDVVGALDIVKWAFINSEMGSNNE